MLKQGLLQYFGFSEFRLGQEQVVNTICAGSSAAAIFPTGSGKSLCYQLPAVFLPNLTLVISPLIALMQDQLAFLQSKGIPAACIDSSVSRDDVQLIMDQVKAGQTKILMVAVERLKNERFRQFISQVPISLLVIDEAHCISEWGHNFRPDYLKLPQYQKDFNIPQALLLTATATPQVIEDMGKKFQIESENITATGFYRPNLSLMVKGVRESERLDSLTEWLKPKHNNGISQSTIVYVTLQQTSEQVAAYLSQQGLNAQAYHAGMSAESRTQIQTEFMQGRIPIIVATIAFGMGIDKSDIRNVVHYDLPKSIENYSQEIGRAGRDGQQSECLVLANKDSLNVLENFVYGDTPTLAGVMFVLNDITENQQNGQWECQLYGLSTDSNIKQLPLKTLLVYLEMQGVIRPKYAYFAEYKFKLLVDENTIVNRFEGERRAFVQALLQYSKKAKTWWTADLDAISNNYESDRNRIIRALEYFDKQNLIELQSKQMTEVYEVSLPFFDLKEQSSQIAEKMMQLFAQKEASEINRIHHMLTLFEENVCISAQLSQYFGDTTFDTGGKQQCGHCHVCFGQPAQIPAAPAQQNIDSFSYQNLSAELINKTPQDLLSIELITRYFCGIATPIFTKYKTRGTSGFGALSHYRYQDVLEWVRHSTNTQ